MTDAWFITRSCAVRHRKGVEIDVLRRAYTACRRRGVRYAAYFLLRHARLRWLYHHAWGPESSPAARALFRVMARLASRTAPAPLLRRIGLVETDGVAAMDAPAAAVIMDRAHAAGVTGVAHGRFRLHRWRGACYLAERDSDRRTFNRHFAASLLTEQAARRQLDVLRGEVRNGYRDYAPIDFGGGLSFGRIASTDSGTGRWEFFNGSIVGPLVTGKRVLDLGCNNGSLTLMMLRAGAREVVAIELTPEIAEVARLNMRSLAWRDVVEYHGTVLTGDMRLWLAQDLGRFDVVTAFCSLYYLPESDMAGIIGKAAGMGATMILQANDAIENLPADTATLRRLLHDNGYGNVHLSAYPGFARPLLIGSPAQRV